VHGGQGVTFGPGPWGSGGDGASLAVQRGRGFVGHLIQATVELIQSALLGPQFGVDRSALGDRVLLPVLDGRRSDRPTSLEVRGGRTARDQQCNADPHEPSAILVTMSAATTRDPRRPFGRLATAMVTPFSSDGALDLERAAALAAYLVDEQHNDALVISGTTGEGPTTSDAEKSDLLGAVCAAVGDRAQIIAGVGTFDPAHSVHLAELAAKAGADALLVVTPYYSKPPQAGLLDYFTTVADATDLPVMVYDIPGRTGTPIHTETLLRLAEHDRIVAVKDAKGDIVASSRVLAETDLAYYSGDDALTLPLLSVGAVGLVGTSTHFSGSGAKAMIEAYERGDAAGALELHRRLLPIFSGIFRTQGTILVKAGFALRGAPVGSVRSPLVDATEDERAQLARDLAAAGL
jgi:4-hydroxy-tetrahydrodipicolinate synthase